jgi:capsule polysaccharide export protein KpsE/RkpR
VSLTSSASTRKTTPEVSDRDFVDPPSNLTASESEDALERLQLLWARRVLLFRTGAYALVASVLAAFLVPARFESTARLMPPDNQSPVSGLAAAATALSGGGASGGIASLAGDYLGLKSTSDVFVGILLSRTVQDKLVQQFDLKKLYWDRRLEDARKDLADRTSISVDRKSQIITITVTDRSPKRAAAMAQAYVEELNRLVAELSTSSARRERIFLEGRLESVGQDLGTAEREFSQFASKNTAIDVKEQGKAMVEAAATVQGQLIAAQSQYEGLRQIYTDNNPRVKTVKARITELQHQLEKLGGKGESTTTVSDQPSDSLYPSIRKLPLLGVTYADLYRRTKIQEAVLETLTKEYEMAKVQEAKEIPTVRILDSPDIPDKKSFPPRGLIVFFGTALSLVAAAGWVLGSDAWKKTDSTDPRKVFAQEVLSTVASRFPGLSQNGSGQSSADKGAWKWMRRRDTSDRGDTK